MYPDRPPGWWTLPAPPAAGLCRRRLAWSSGLVRRPAWSSWCGRWRWRVAAGGCWWLSAAAGRSRAAPGGGCLQRATLHNTLSREEKLLQWQLSFHDSKINLYFQNFNRVHLRYAAVSLNGVKCIILGKSQRPSYHFEIFNLWDCCTVAFSNNLMLKSCHHSLPP